ncbi:MAG: PspC domain-containing protein [Chloroflexota bacterium]|nr:PspC domain-containing protein [Chloroflexota bacterium]MDE2839251.1 PspC domain-containing protein [Chloroflexota bacterium]MDE2932139.1 PspC domain-containing protein [Chloroflexota bacterium]
MAETVEPAVRRLMRSRTDRTCAGVCGGLAEYIDWDPTIVRLLWILALFLSGGMALFAYLVFWIVMPEAPAYAHADAGFACDNRLTRSRDERMLAGVCGGLAEFLGMDTTLMRVLWVVATFISGGVTLIAYPIFWLVMPESGRLTSAADDTFRDVADRVDPMVERIGDRVRETFNREPRTADPAAAKRSQEQELENEILGISEEDLQGEQQQEAAAPKVKAQQRWLPLLGAGLITVGLIVLAGNVDWLWFSPESLVILVIGALLLFYRSGEEPRPAWRTWVGGGLVLLSTLTLLESLSLFWFSDSIIPVVLMMGIGGAMLVHRNRVAPRPAWRTWIGGGLVGFGALILIDELLPSFVSDLTWPLAIIGFGALLLWQWSRRKAAG